MLHNLDSDSSKIIEAVRSTGVVVTEAMRLDVDYIVSNMKAIGTWQLSNAVYGFVGGTADSHKWNWKDLRDVDAAFRLTFPNGMTHSSGGIKGNGTNQSANTFFNPSTQILNLNQFSVMLYTDGSSDVGIDIGLNQGTNRIALVSKFSVGGNASSQLYDVGATLAVSGLYSSKGFFIANRQSITSNKLWRNGVIISSNTNSNPLANLSTLNGNIGISALYDLSSVGTNFTSRRQQFVGFVNGVLTDTQAQQQSQIVTNAQLILNRA